MITNLVENAIKYNKENGWVHVSLNADHKYFYLKVADSGIGIPKEDTDHIFERFFRVDKSHSREIGGTGLGLSIAAVRSRSTVNRERERHLQSGSRLLISRGKGEKNEKKLPDHKHSSCSVSSYRRCGMQKKGAESRCKIHDLPD